MIPESSHDPSAVTLTSHASISRSSHPTPFPRLSLTIVAFIGVLALDAMVAVGTLVAYETRVPRPAVHAASDAAVNARVSLGVGRE